MFSKFFSYFTQNSLIFLKIRVLKNRHEILRNLSKNSALLLENFSKFCSKLFKSLSDVSKTCLMFTFLLKFSKYLFKILHLFHIFSKFFYNFLKVLAVFPLSIYNFSKISSKISYFLLSYAKDPLKFSWNFLVISSSNFGQMFQFSLNCLKFFESCTRKFSHEYLDNCLESFSPISLKFLKKILNFTGVSLTFTFLQNFFEIIRKLFQNFSIA